MQHTGTGLVTTTCHYKHNLFDYTVLQHMFQILKKMMGHGSAPTDPSNNGDPCDPLTHRPIAYPGKDCKVYLLLLLHSSTPLLFPPLPSRLVQSALSLLQSGSFKYSCRGQGITVSSPSWFFSRALARNCNLGIVCAGKMCLAAKFIVRFVLCETKCCNWRESSPAHFPGEGKCPPSCPCTQKLSQQWQTVSGNNKTSGLKHCYITTQQSNNLGGYTPCFPDHLWGTLVNKNYKRMQN